MATRTKNKKGFTLIELLVVIGIIGLLAALGIVSVTTAQKKGRDSRRKSDLRAVAGALELFYQRNGTYPTSDNGGTGRIQCPAGSTTSSIDWGTPFTCTSSSTGQTITYMQTLPKEPLSSQNQYYYETGSQGPGTWKLSAHIENTKDPEYNCGGCPNSSDPSICNPTGGRLWCVQSP